ncbi:MAG: S1C family serine protease, partial [bacterium]
MKVGVQFLVGLLAGLGLVLTGEKIWLKMEHPSAGRIAAHLEGVKGTPAQMVSPPLATSPSLGEQVSRTEQSVETSRRNAITRAVEKVSPSVVGISVIAVREYRARHPFADDPFLRQFFPDQIYRQKVENLGSGFIISPDGFILTNEHVVHEASRIIVTTTQGEKYDAELVGYDYEADIALLKIEGKGFPHLEFGNSDDCIIGEWAIALGNPFGLFAIHAQPSVSVGVISALDRDFERNADGRLYLDMIQTDAAINRGNSGGPLVNAEGYLIGMATMIFTEAGGSIGLGFAIPSNKLKAVYEQLRTRGKIDRDYWIGLSIQDVNRLIAISLRLPEIRGAVITEVEPGSPAEKAGLE